MKESQQPKILPFFMRRRVGECVNTGVALFKFYRKTMLRLALLVLLPIALVHAVSVFSVGQRSLDNSENVSSDYVVYYSDYYNVYFGPDDRWGTNEWALIAMQSLAILAIMAIATAVAVRHHEDEPRGDEDTVRTRVLPLKSVFRTMGTHWWRILLTSLGCALVLWLIFWFYSEAWGNTEDIVLVSLFVVIPFMMPMLFVMFMIQPHVSLKVERKKKTVLGMIFSRFGAFLGLVYVALLVFVMAQVVTELPWSLLISIRDTLLERSVATNVTASWAFEVLLYLYTAFCLLYAYVSVLIVILVCFYFHGDTVARKALGTDELELLIENFDQP